MQPLFAGTWKAAERETCWGPVRLAVGVTCFHFQNGLAPAPGINSDGAEQMKIHFPALRPQAHEDQTDATRANN